MHKGVVEWVPELKGRILEIGKRQINHPSPYPDSYGVDLNKGAGVDLVCDARDLPFGNDSWEHVVCLETLEHVEDWRGVVREMWRVCDKTVVITTPTAKKGYHAHPDDYWRWTLEQWLQVFKDQQILKSGATWGKGIGIWVRKRTSELDLSVEPGVAERKNPKVRKGHG